MLLHTKKFALMDEEGNPKYLLGISENVTGKRLEADQSQTQGEQGNEKVPRDSKD